MPRRSTPQRTPQEAFADALEDVLMDLEIAVHDAKRYRIPHAVTALEAARRQVENALGAVRATRATAYTEDEETA